MSLTEFYNLHKNKTYIHPDRSQFEDIINNNHRIPYLSLKLDGPWKQMLAEAQALDHMFVGHRDTEGSNGWSSLCVHGLGAQKTDAPNSYPEYQGIDYDDLPFDWTEIATSCPVTVDYFRNTFPYARYDRLRFMRLAPGGYIVPHNDSNLHSLFAVNISLNNPDGCEMVLEDIGVVPFSNNGGAIAFNNSHNHMVWNQSLTPRYHMIIHGTWDSRYYQVLEDSYPQNKNS